jgi:hypothetical protein
MEGRSLEEEPEIPEGEQQENRGPRRTEADPGFGQRIKPRVDRYPSRRLQECQADRIAPDDEEPYSEV